MVVSKRKRLAAAIEEKFGARYADRFAAFIDRNCNQTMNYVNIILPDNFLQVYIGQRRIVEV